MPTGAGRVQRATNIVRAAVGIGRRAAAAEFDYRARQNDAVAQRQGKRAANARHGAQMRWPTSQATGDSMRRDQARVANEAQGAAWRAVEAGGRNRARANRLRSR
jgi:hypothetical protein